MQRRIAEISDFLKQCIQELLGRKKGQGVRNSDLRVHSFATTPEPLKPRKRSPLGKVRSRFQRKRPKRVEAYAPTAEGKTPLLRILPLLGGALAITIFLVCDGPLIVGGLFTNISLFKVEKVHIVGCEAASKERLRLLTGINLYQTSLLGLDRKAIAARVAEDPWVSRAEVKRDWPAEVVIDVVEHRPIAMVNMVETGEPRLFYVDRKGVAFLPVGPGNDVDFPVITGLADVGDREKYAEAFSDIVTFLKLVRRNNPNLPAQSVSEIHVTEFGELVVYLVDYTFPIFFGKGAVREKYTRLVRVLDALYREKRKGMLISGVEYIRMDYLNDKVLVAQSESG